MKAGIYLGYPGIGKTPMAKEERNVMDLDAGHVRTALSQVSGLPEDQIDKQELARFIAVLALNYVNEGWAVITNLPAVMDYAKVVKMYVPSSATGVKKAAEKLGIDPSNVQTYLEEWSLSAKAHDVPVVKLRRGIDYIFRQHRHKMLADAVIVDQAPREAESSNDDDRDSRKMGEFWD